LSHKYNSVFAKCSQNVTTATNYCFKVISWGCTQGMMQI
jgi:hypothetical protein